MDKGFVCEHCPLKLAYALDDKGDNGILGDSDEFEDEV